MRARGVNSKAAIDSAVRVVDKATMSGSFSQIQPEISFYGDTQRGAPAPWWAKIAAKLVLSRAPVSYRAWKKLGMFAHSSPQAQIEGQLARAGGYFETFRAWGEGEARCVLELGPGDNLALAAPAKALGARRILFVDVADFAQHDAEAMARLAAECASVAPGLIVDASSREAMLRSCDAVYLTDGFQSLRAIAPDSVDMHVSNAVLEHVRAAQFDAHMDALFALTRPGGIGLHSVDFKDHLGGSLNNLRFSERVWESEFMARSGFYTNRIRPSAMVQSARRAGFETALLGVCRFTETPLPRSAMAEPFRGLPEEELNVASFDLLLRKPTVVKAGEKA